MSVFQFENPWAQEEDEEWEKGDVGEAEGTHAEKRAGRGAWSQVDLTQLSSPGPGSQPPGELTVGQCHEAHLPSRDDVWTSGEPVQHF